MIYLPHHKEGKAPKQEELRATLQEFIDRISAIDLESLSLANPDELLQLTEEIRHTLSAVEEMASKGTLVTA